MTSTPTARLPRPAALWLQGSLTLAFLAASSAPSPLYALYREAWGFSALALTGAFASYAFTLLAALLVFGRASDHAGRRPVLLAAITLELLSLLLFHQAGSLADLVLARSLQGLATGIATSALSAGLMDLSPQRGALVNALTPMLGMALGALGASALVWLTPTPTRTVFTLLIALFAVQGGLALFLPETAAPRPGLLASLRPRLALPPAARGPLMGLLPLGTAAWALGGFYLSLGPTLARIVCDTRHPMTGGALIATLVLCGAAAILRVRERDPARVLPACAVLLGTGVAATLGGVLAHAPVLFFGGTAVAGLGFGGGFIASVRRLAGLAAAHERAGLMATYFVLSYLAFSLPALAAGLAAGRWGLPATTVAYAGGLVLLSGVAWWRMQAERRLAPAALPA